MVVGMCIFKLYKAYLFNTLRVMIIRNIYDFISILDYFSAKNQQK